LIKKNLVKVGPSFSAPPVYATGSAWIEDIIKLFKKRNN
jgi:hypothetical protein